MEEILIEKVRDYEFLYNHTLLEYRDQQMRQSAWEEIGSELKIPAAEAKERWDKLRRCFSNARSRRLIQTKSGVSAKKKSLWKYEEIMSFILPFSDTRKTHSNLNDSQSSDSLATEADILNWCQTQQDEETIATLDPLQNLNDDMETGNECNARTNEVAENQSSVNNTRTTKTPLEPVKLVKKKNKRPSDSQDSPTHKLLKMMKEYYDLRTLRHEQKTNAATSEKSFFESLDDSDLFFLSMSRMTKQLPKSEQVQIKLALSNSVLSAELRANAQQ